MAEVKDNLRSGLRQGAGDAGLRRGRVRLDCVAWLVEWR